MTDSPTDSLGRRLWATTLTGIPFAIFKLGAGVWLEAHFNQALGVALIVWGGLDIALNLISLAFPDRFSYCLLSNFGRQFEKRDSGDRRWEAVSLAADTLFAFLIVSAMIWLRLLPELPPGIGRVWDVAVVANIVGVGVERLWQTWRVTPAVSASAT
jgi:hypothetical protein